MKFYLHKIIKGDNNFFTWSVIQSLAKQHGHKMVDDPAAADAHLVSLCDVTQLPALAKVRKENRDKKIIAGGHFAVNFMAVALFADLVNVGHGFEFFKCQTFEEMAALESVYYPGKSGYVRPSAVIEWSRLPVVQTSEKMYYYMGGAGCRNKCKFCMTSWTNKYQSNSEMRIKKAESLVPPGARLNVISNAYDSGLRKSPVKDMMLVDFVKVRKKTTNLVRAGLEFATPATRKKYGKPFDDSLILEAFAVAKKYKIELQLFCIGGINTREEWLKLFDLIPIEPARTPKIYFKFTNLQYEQFTPMYKERRKLKLKNYLDGEFGKKLFYQVGVRNKRIRIFPIANPCLAIWRMGMQLVTDMDQYDAWYSLRNSKDLKAVYDALYGTNVINTDYSDRIRFWFQKGAPKNDK